jgi:hypothetical protein
MFGQSAGKMRQRKAELVKFPVDNKVHRQTDRQADFTNEKYALNDSKNSINLSYCFWCQWAERNKCCVSDSHAVNVNGF